MIVYILFYLYIDDMVTGGTVDISAMYGVLHYFSATYDLCDESNKGGLPCNNIKIGPNHILYKFYIRSFQPLVSI